MRKYIAQKAMEDKEKMRKLNLQADYAVKNSRSYRARQIALLSYSEPEEKDFTIKDILYLIIALFAVIALLSAMTFLLVSAGIL